MLASLGSPAGVATWRDLPAQGKTAEALAAVEKSAGTDDPQALDFRGWFYDEGRGDSASRCGPCRRRTPRRAAQVMFLELLARFGPSD